ncbi:uncharacterized protein LOC113350959 [Papaver somniferum]|uniref:uncharacterized protein LOC113350959 n=1 Tax=Papaver somniferum TaxID=3469 RepID=UPI000E6FCA0C|nr:uncharacterized protein LOC113350959 [Papaver somniferum]
MKFLQDIYYIARDNPVIGSAALESLDSFSSEDFLCEDPSFLENASLNLTLQQHAPLMGLEVNRHMANLVETRLSWERLDTAHALIKKLIREINEEKEYGSKQDKKNEKLRSNEELNHYLRIENQNLNIELQRVNNSLTTSRNLHSTSLSLNKRLEEDKGRIINMKDKSESKLHKSRG